MALHIHHGSHLVPLVDSLADLLAQPLADPFTAEVIAVPTAGIRDWLQQHLALRLGTGDQLLDQHAGVSANIDMLFPSRFTAAVLGQDRNSSGPWDLDRLTWTVLSVLWRGAVAVPGWRNLRHGTYATGRRIADLFDGYATNRPQLIQQWAHGHDGDGTVDERGAVVPLAPDHRWQPALWRAVREEIGLANPAELLPGLLADLTSGRIEPTLPARVAVFGLSAVSAAQLTLLQALGHVREVHLYLVHPSPAGWAGVRQQLAGRLVLRSACDASAAVVHPLLRSWGRPAMEAAALVGALDGGTGPDSGGSVRVTGHEPTPRSADRSLLHQIQSGLLADRLAPVGDQCSGDQCPGDADASVQVHACHGTVRQLEVLRDALGHIFASDPALTARDIVVLCPDLDRFAALIPSVFQRSTLPIPVQVTDLSLGSGNPVATALVDVLGLLAGRCTGPEIHALCSLTPVRATFGFDDDGLERIGRWITDLGVTWGLDRGHRGDWVPDTIAEGTWTATLDRLLLGAAMPAPTPRVGPGDIVPFDDMDAAALATAGQLAEIIHRLVRLRRAATGTHSIEEWIVVLTDLVRSLLTTSADDAWQTIEIMETISDIGRAASVGDTSSVVPLALGDVRSLLSGVLDDAHGRLNLRSGAVTVTTMVPVRNLPSRVVCILGLDDIALRPSSGDGDDLLGARPCVGERDPRAESRHLLLDALMAAGDHLVITCDGSDITTNRPLPLPVLVEELLDIVRACRPSAAVVTRHPRQAYDERNFGVVGDGTGTSPFSFDAAMLAAAEMRRRQPTTIHVTNADLAVLAEWVPPVITVAQLADAVTRPARTYLGQRLDVRLPRPVEDVDTDIPLGVGQLDLWQLAGELLGHRRRGSSTDTVQAWRDAKRRGGTLPPRSLADAVIDDVIREVDILLGARPDMIELIQAAGTAEIDLPISCATSGGRATTRLRQSIGQISADLLVRVEFSRPKNRHTIATALELAALVVSQPERAWEAIVVLRPPSAASSKPSVTTLRPRRGAVGAAAAQRLLETSAAIMVQALREPIPMFDKSSRSMYTDGTIVDEEFESDLRDSETSFVWGESTPDEVLALEVRADDLAAVARSATDGAAVAPGRRTGGRAVGFARSFWSAFEDFVGNDVGNDVGSADTTAATSSVAAPS